MFSLVLLFIFQISIAFGYDLLYDIIFLYYSDESCSTPETNVWNVNFTESKTQNHSVWIRYEVAGCVFCLRGTGICFSTLT